MKLGIEYAAKLKQFALRKKHELHTNQWSTQFTSPISKALPRAFLDFAQWSGTDKVTDHAYHYAYTRYLSHVRFTDLRMLEIGLGCDMGYGPGASLKLWHAFLPCAKISFVEYDRDCSVKWKDSVEKEAGGKLYIGSQDDPALLGEIVADAKAEGGFDMIVDDGSHIPQEQMSTLRALWPAIKPGGIYVIEDLHDHYFLQRPLDGYEPPELPIPLYQRLIHLINCRIESFYKFDVSGRSWCRNEVQLSMFENVISVDCQPELCVLVKGSPVQLPEAEGDELAYAAKIARAQAKGG